MLLNRWSNFYYSCSKIPICFGYLILFCTQNQSYFIKTKNYQAQNYCALTIIILSFLHDTSLKSHTLVLSNPSPFIFGRSLKHHQIWWTLVFTSLLIFTVIQVVALCRYPPLVFWRSFSPQRYVLGCSHVGRQSDDPDSVLLLTTWGFLSESSHILLSPWFLPSWWHSLLQTHWSIPTA